VTKDGRAAANIAAEVISLVAWTVTSAPPADSGILG
jgi:hypothetical protein